MSFHLNMIPPILNNVGPANSNSPSNCQSTLIQTSQNQCYIVVQLNLENTNGTLTRYQVFNVLSILYVPFKGKQITKSRIFSAI